MGLFFPFWIGFFKLVLATEEAEIGETGKIGTVLLGAPSSVQPIHVMCVIIKKRYRLEAMDCLYKVSLIH